METDSPSQHEQANDEVSGTAIDGVARRDPLEHAGQER
jgi:hypothetical protein